MGVGRPVVPVGRLVLGCRGGSGNVGGVGDLEGCPRRGGAFVVEPFDEAEECLDGEHLGERVVLEVDGDDDAPELFWRWAHSVVTSVTAARVEDSSTMALSVA